MTEWHAGDKVRVRFNGHWYEGMVYRVARKTIRVEFATRNGTKVRQKAYGHDDVRVDKRRAP